MPMRLPIVRGLIDRRILVNFRVDPDVLGALLPQPFRPHLVHGWGMAGVCLIRLRAIRPRFLPAILGVSSENAAHRFSVEWEQAGQLRQGVYVPRRDTSSRLSVLAGGRLFPGRQHHARFKIIEQGDWCSVTVDSDDRATHLLIEGGIARELPEHSVFRSLREASDFFQAGSLGYSDTGMVGEFDGLELRTFAWRLQPLGVMRIESSFFDDKQRFPEGSVAFDCALHMQNLEHEWREQPALLALSCSR